MNRRTWLKGAAALGGFALVGGGVWVSLDKDIPSIEQMLQHLAWLRSQNLKSTGVWSAGQIFHHVAQSIEYSMTGYPEHKSEFFKQTVGPAAFAIFAAKGQMHHNLSEAIPGAPSLQQGDDVPAALQRVHDALVYFQNYSGDLKEHFAYGILSRDEYVQAHVMHLLNHLSEIVTG